MAKEKSIKNKYWTAVLYLENMVENWQDDIGDLLQLPFSYCIHDKDTTSKEEEDRKPHVHIILAFPNTTTYNHASNVFKSLEAPGRRAFNKIESVINIRFAYEYLIHNTEGAKKKNKFEYSPDERISGNNFDIGSFEQLSVSEKNDMCRELCNYIMENQYVNFADFYCDFVFDFEDTNYFEILKTYSGLFERLIKGNYHRYSGKVEE